MRYALRKRPRSRARERMRRDARHREMATRTRSTRAASRPNDEHMSPCQARGPEHELRPSRTRRNPAAVRDEKRAPVCRRRCFVTFGIGVGPGRVEPPRRRICDAERRIPRAWPPRPRTRERAWSISRPPARCSHRQHTRHACRIVQARARRTGAIAGSRRYEEQRNVSPARPRPSRATPAQAQDRSGRAAASWRRSSRGFRRGSAGSAATDRENTAVVPGG